MDDQFLRELQEALNHLYDPDQLRRSPLAARLQPAGRANAPARLHTMLVEAIEELKPKQGIPSQARSWRIYDLLNFCYLQQLSQEAAANQLGISSRHLRRERQAAIEALAYVLIEKFPGDFTQAVSLESQKEAPAAQKSIPTVSEELAWVKDLPAEAAVDFHFALSEVLELIRPLADQYKVQVEVQESSSLPDINLHPVVLNQVLLDLFSMLIHCAPQGSVILSAEGASQGVTIQATGRPCSPEWQATHGEGSGLDGLRHLAGLCGCRVNLSHVGDQVTVEVFLPAAEQLPVLVIDDNLDTLQLFQRYTEGTCYRLVGAQNLDGVLRLVEEVAPQLILLDVMMPTVDGWHMLGQLRNLPSTAAIPVVICTVLAQDDLAISLGASGFLRKPVTRPDFLAALDRQFEQMEKGARSAT